jgi:hypothetical protein
VSFAEMLENPQCLVQLSPKSQIQTFHLLIFKGSKKYEAVNRWTEAARNHSYVT